MIVQVYTVILLGLYLNGVLTNKSETKYLIIPPVDCNYHLKF